MKYFLIAGEPSGDMHAAELMRQLKLQDADSHFAFFGGDLMAEQDPNILKHYREMAFMGIVPVLLNLRKIIHNFKGCEKALLDFNPDVLILIDYPGFNLRMARFAKQNKIKTAYYISPKVWAWKRKRVKKIKAFIDRLYTIFPFETEFFKQFDYPVTYVGNPVYDKVKAYNQKNNFEEFCTKNKLLYKPIIALLPGSRTDEIKRLLPVISQMAENFPEFQFVVSGAPNQPESFYKEILNSDYPILFNVTYELLTHSKAAIVASGTATLETALFEVPQIVVYKMGMGWFLETFRKQILKTDYFSLVNLVAEKKVVLELFQSQVTNRNMETELNKILYNKKYRNKIIQHYQKLAETLKSEGAAISAAKAIVNFTKE